ncbi:MBL fold metallo-hydrolase [Halobacillus andaensis]|uniref:MBL fold metallo-hydrolase n=1 Tax=Halobacillus andaensis TaxID=1176239 RepID=UPI003D73D775
MFKNAIFIFFSALSLLFTAACGEETTGPPDDQQSQDTMESQQEQEVTEKENTEEEEESKEEENTVEEPEEETGDAEDENAEGSADEEEVQDEKEEQPSEEQEEVEQLSSDLTAHFIDVGQADATLIEFEDRGQPIRILIDAGNWNGDQVINYLHSQGVEQIDIAIGTHPDADHIGQLDCVVEQFNVGEVWMSGNESTSETYERVLDAIESNGAEYVEPRAGEAFDIGPLAVNVLYPEMVTGELNQESISLKMSYGEVDFLFTGDAEADDEAKMINGNTNLEAEILQLGHHGSSTSTSSAFLEEVKPETAIYSAGEDNQYGHPGEEVVQRVQNAGIELFGTDVHGTIKVTTNGQGYEIATSEEGTVEPSSNETSESESEQEEEEPEQESESEAGNAGDCVDINSASLEEVQEITQIGPARAEDLVKQRPYESVEELTKINGIGPARIDEIKVQGVACVGG